MFTQPFILAQIKVNIKAPVTVLCVGNSPGTGEFPAQMASYAENVSIRWRHHGLGYYQNKKTTPDRNPAAPRQKVSHNLVKYGPIITHSPQWAMVRLSTDIWFNDITYNLSIWYNSTITRMAQYELVISDHAIFGHGARCPPKVAVSIYYDIFARGPFINMD